MKKLRQLVLAVLRWMFERAGGEIRPRIYVVDSVPSDKARKLEAVCRIDEREFERRHDSPRVIDLVDRELRAQIGDAAGKAAKLEFFRDLERDPFTAYRKATLTIVEGA